MSRRTNEESKRNEPPLHLLSEYEVIKKLGRGGMGIVYLVRYRLTKRVEVVKVLRPALALRPRLRERFLREVQVAARLDHPNIVRTFTAVQNGDVLGLVMEYVDGRDLESIVKHSGPLTVASSSVIIQQAALGLQHAADRGLVHRDIKPSNILVSRQEGQLVAKLSDFGLSKLHDEAVNNGLTIEGRFLGTPDYMAPEQGLDASSATVAADIYGLGCSLYYALVGRPPYTGANALAVLNAQVHAAIPDACMARHDVPRELNAVLQRMLQKDPRDRYTTPLEVANALEAFVSTEQRSVPAEQSQVSPHWVEQTPTSGSHTDHEPHESESEFRVPVRSGVTNRRRRSRAPVWQSLLQVAMPIALVAGIMYLQPWKNLTQNADGTLLLKELTPGTVIEIDNSIKLASDTDKTFREVRLSPGHHSLRFVYDGKVISQRSLEIKSNQTVELSASLAGLPNKKLGPRQPARNPSARIEKINPNLQKRSADTFVVPGQSDQAVDVDSIVESSITMDPPEDTSPQNKQPELRLINPTWSGELDRQLTGLERSPDGLMIIPRDLANLETELIIATGQHVSAWDAKTGFPSSIFTPFNVRGISIANNEKSVLYFDDSKCEVWVVKKPKPQKWFWTPEGLPVKRVFAMSSDSRHLASCDFNELFVRWDLSTKKAVGTMSARQPLTAQHVQSIQLTARLENVVTLGTDGTLTCWSSSSGEQLGIVEAMPDASGADRMLSGLHINNGSRQAILVTTNGYLETRKLPSLELTDRQKVCDEAVASTAYSTRLLLVANRAGAIALLDGTDFTVVGTIISSPGARVETMAVSNDAKCVAIGYADGTIHVWRLRRTSATDPT